MSLTGSENPCALAPAEAVGRLIVVPKGTMVWNPDRALDARSRREQIVLVRAVSGPYVCWETTSSYRMAPADSVRYVSEHGDKHQITKSLFVRGKTAVRPQRNLYGYELRCTCGFARRVNGTAGEAHAEVKAHVAQAAQAETEAAGT